MSSVVILGSNGSGRSTFFTLLYATQIRYAGTAGGEFRFYTEPKYIELVSKEYNNMLLGDWPSEEFTNRLDEVSFVYNYKTKSIIEGLLGGIFKKDSDNYVPANFALYDLRDKNVTSRIKDFLRSGIITVLINPSKFGSRAKTVNGQEEKHGGEEEKHDTRMALGDRNDDVIADVLTDISRYTKGAVYPLIVFTKFNLVPKGILLDLGLPDKPPAPGSKSADKDRMEYSRKIMEKYYPNTLNFINRKYAERNIGTYFFSSVETTHEDDGRFSPAIKKEFDGPYLLDYSYDEYEGFIRVVGEVTKQLLEEKNQ